MKLKFQLRGRSFLPCLLVLCLHFTATHAQEPIPILHDIQTSTLIGLMEQELSSSSNWGKRVQVFGGSLSVLPQSETAKELWRTHLGMDVQSCGRGGAGFALDESQPDVNMASNNGLEFHADKNSIQRQVWWYASSKYDIYVLWASTNDYTMNFPMGSPTDYTEADGYDKGKLGTQCGGMNYCIRHLRKLNPKAEIYIFSSLPFFEHDGGYRADSGVRNKTGHSFHEYVQAQREVAALQGIPFLDQFSLPGFDTDHESLYYIDKYHLTEVGYLHLAPYQLYFLATGHGMEKLKSGCSLSMGRCPAAQDSEGNFLLPCVPTDSAASVSPDMLSLESGDMVALFWDNRQVGANAVVGTLRKAHNLLAFARIRTDDQQPDETLIPPLGYVDAKVELTTLPVVVLNLNPNDRISKELEARGTMTVIDPQGRTNSTTVNTFHIKAHYRGDTASTFDKKSYSISLFNEDGDELETKLFGIRKDDKWILDAMAIDCSRMRNRLCFETWNEMSGLQSATMKRNGIVCEYVELLLNGEYRGVYDLSDKVNRSLLGIGKVEEGASGDVVLHGLLYKDKHASYGTNFLTMPENAWSTAMDGLMWYDWELKYPDDHPSEQAWQPLVRLIEFCDSIDDHPDYVSKHLYERFHERNIIDYTVLLFAYMPADNMMHNCYLSFQDVQQQCPAWITPWDMDGSLGRNGHGVLHDFHVGSWRTLQDTKPFRKLYDERIGDYYQHVAERWQTLCMDVLSPARFCERVDSLAGVLAQSGTWRREHAVWNGNPIELGESPQEETDYMKMWYERNFEHLSREYGGFLSSVEMIEEDAVHEKNGQDFNIYDLSGRPLKSKPERGFYIQNGKKYLK